MHMSICSEVCSSGKDSPSLILDFYFQERQISSWAVEDDLNEEVVFVP